MPDRRSDRGRDSRLGALRSPLLLLVVALLAIPPALAVLDVPGEGKVKNALGISVRPVGQECGQIRDAGSPNGPWRSERKLAAPRDEIRAAAVGRSIYLVGGITSLDLSVEPGTAESVNTFQRYDVDRRRFVALPQLPERLNHVGMAAYRGDVYVVGGFGDQLGRARATSDAWRYRPSERRWQRIDPLPTARAALGLTVVGHRMYAIGGRSFFDRPKRVDAYDFRSGKWSQVASMPTGRDHVGVGVAGGKIYAAGGRQEGDYSLGAFERYDPAADRWTKLPDIPRPASSFELLSVASRLVAPGGGDANSKPYFVSGQTWAYDPGSGRWSQLAKLPEPKHGYAGAVVADRMYLFGGSRCGAFRATDSTESLGVTRASR